MQVMRIVPALNEPKHCHICLCLRPEAELLRSRPNDARSTATLMEEPVEVDGVPLQIVELTGEPGDAVLCHPAVLHAVSMNCSTVPRFMRRTNVRRKR